MATRARFGRLPRSAPSLTSTIVSLAQQYQGQRDRNIEGAWKEGGLFEGKKVTDTTFLAHWKGRLKDVSSDDPMWDYYNNMIHTYEFEIEESKMGLKYAEEKVSEGQMAAFYRQWANKLPHDSEAYRSLMTQAAKFKAAATARGHAGRARSSDQSYQNAQNNTYQANEAPYDVATGLIARYAEQAGYLDSKDLNDKDYGWSKLTNASGEDDPANFAALLVDLTNDPAVSAFITAEIKRYDPNFSGVFNAQTMTALANNARNGATIRLNRAQQAGKKGDSDDAKASMDKYSLQATIVAVSLGRDANDSFVEQNSHYREQMDAMLADGSGASPSQKQAAVQQYEDWLTGPGVQTLTRALPAGSLDPMSPNFNATATGILGRVNNTVNSLNGQSTGQTLKDDLFGFSGEEAGESSDGVRLQEQTRDLQFQMDNIAAGSAVVVRTDGKGKPTPNGTSWEVFSRDAPEVAGNDNLVPMVVPSYGTYTSSDGKTTIGGRAGEVRYQVAVPVKVRVHQFQDPATGAYTGQAKAFEGMDDVVGKQVDIVGPGGNVIPVYGTYQGGRLIWSTVNPFQTNPTERVTRDADGTIVHNFTAAQVPQEQVLTGVNKPPEARFNPQSFLNQGMLMSPSSKENWNPATDKQTAYDSPLSALANSSSEHMRWVADLGNEAVANGEKEWYSNKANWTKDMTEKFSAAIQTGADPNKAFEATVAGKSQELMNVLTYNRAMGYTPEMQQASRNGMKLRAETEAAARQGLTLPQWQAAQKQSEETAVRDDLIAKLDNWNVTIEQGRQSAAGARGVPPGQQGVQPTDKLPKGWSAKDLLTQPGMNLQAANDLAFRISGGQYGKPFSYAPKDVAGRMGTTVTMPGQNPFMPAPGTTGRSWQLGPTAVNSPKPAPPTPALPVGPPVPKATTTAPIPRVAPRSVGPGGLVRDPKEGEPLTTYRPPPVRTTRRSGGMTIL